LASFTFDNYGHSVFVTFEVLTIAFLKIQVFCDPTLLGEWFPMFHRIRLLDHACAA